MASWVCVKKLSGETGDGLPNNNIKNSKIFNLFHSVISVAQMLCLLCFFDLNTGRSYNQTIIWRYTAAYKAGGSRVERSGKGKTTFVETGLEAFANDVISGSATG